MRRALLACALACGSSESAPPAPAPKPAPTKTGLVPAHPVDCTREGWCRLPDLDPDDLLHGVASDAPGKLWAVGAAGLVFRYDGKTLAHARIPSGDLEAVAACGDAVWAVDADNRVWHRHGNTPWKRVAAGAASTVPHITCAGDDAWVLGEGLTILRIAHDGTKTSLATPIPVYTMWASAPDDIWIAGTNEAGAAAAYRGDGKTWRDTQLPSNGQLQQIELASNPRGDVEIDVDGNAFQWDGHAWRSVAYATLRSRADNGGMIPIAFGDGATVDRELQIHTGDKVTALRARLPIADPALWVGPDAVWLAGVHDGKAVVARWDGARFTTEVLPGGGVDPAVVIGGDGEPWVAATGGHAWHRSGGKWVHETTGVDPSWLAVRGEDVFVASAQQVAIRTGGKWSTSTVDHAIRALGAGGGEVFLATDGGGLLRWTGKAFEHAGTLPATGTLAVRGPKLVDVASESGAWRWHGGDATDELLATHVLGAAAVGDALYLTTLDKGRYGVTIVNPTTKSSVVEPVDEERLFAIGARDGVVWLMQGGSGDLVFKRL